MSFLQEERSANDTGPIHKSIVEQQVMYGHSHADVQMHHREKQCQPGRRTKDQIIAVLPYENTYAPFYNPDEFTPIQQSLIEQIIGGVQAMAAALTSRVKKGFTWIYRYVLQRDVEDVLNGIALLDDQSASPLTSGTNNRITDEVINTLQSKNTDFSVRDWCHRSWVRTFVITKTSSDDQ